MRVILPFLLVACTSVPVEDLEQAITYEQATEQAAPPGVALSLDVSALNAGGIATMNVADADPGEQVFLLRSLNGMGNGPCPPALNGMCVDLTPGIAIMGPITASAAGTGTLSATLPGTVPFGTNVCLQAVAIRSAGAGGSVKSPVVCRVTNNGPVSLEGGLNTGDTFATGVSTGGPGLSIGHKFTAPTDIVAGYAEIFTGNQAGSNTISIWDHDPSTNEPGTLVASGSWDMTDQREWQGADLGQRVVMPQGSTWWIVWEPQNGAQASQDSVGGNGDYRGSFDGGATWNGPFSARVKFRLCGGGGCP